MRLDHLLSKEEEVEEQKALFNYPGSEDLRRSDWMKRRACSGASMQDEMHRTKSVISEMLIELIDRSVNRIWKHLSGGDALRGHTRSHPEHDG